MAGIPSADWSWIDAAAERFERAWKAGEQPRIEDFLIKVPESQWPPLLQELVRVESELRRRAGEEPTADEYRRRFPHHESVITAVFQSAPAASTAADDTEPARSTRATSASLPPAGSLPPELANHPDYEILGELGQGGMGVVYLAHNRIMGRDEVLKVMGQQLVELPGMADRFLREIRAVAKLRHPNIVSAYAAFRCGNNPVFAMEHVEGLDLRRLVKVKGPMPIAHACFFGHQEALGLQHAHEAGMVHRDIKPANLMLSRQKNRAVIKILDFGLSKAASEQNASELGIGVAALPIDFGEHLTCTGEMLGTPDFIAPEQIIDSQKADIRADIYSLGCTLYFLLSGRPPFQESSTRDTLQAQRWMDAPPLDSVRPEVPAELAALVARMMAKDPDRRFQTPREVANALAPFFKKPAAAAVSPNVGGNSAPAPDAGPAAPAPAADAGHELWSSLIDFRETEDDADAIAGAPDPAQERLQWLWPAVTAGVLLCGLIGAWASGILPSVLGKKDRAERAGVETSTGTGEGKPVRVPQEPLVASQPRDTSPAGGPSPGAEASTPTPGATTTARSRDGAGETLPPVAEPSPGNQGPGLPWETTKTAQVFHKITSIPSPDLVLQARLISGSGQVLFETGGRNRALWRADLKDPEKPRKLEASVPGWTHLALSSDGRFAILAGTDHNLWNWDLQTGQSRPLLPGRARITAIALSPDNQLIAYVRDGAIQFCEAAPGATVKRKELNRRIGGGTDLLAFSPDGPRLVSTHIDRSTRVWDVKTRQEIGRAEPPKLVSSLAVFRGDRRVLISLSGPTFVWDLETNRQLRQAPGFGASIALSADGRRALIGGGKFLQLWDLVTGDELEREDHQRAVVHVAFSSDDRQAVSSTDDGVHVWALPPGRAAGELPPVVEVADFPRQHGSTHVSVAVSPDGRWVLTGDWPSAMRRWNRETRQMTHEFNQDGGEIRSVAFSPVGGLALSGGADGVVRLWNLESGEHREFRGHVDCVMSVAFSPDGRRAYSAGGGLLRDIWQEGTDFAVRVWDVETEKQLRPLEGHKGMVLSVAVSTDGRYVLSGGNDAVPILWDARTGREKHRFRGHTERVWCVAFLPDGRRAVSSSDDGTIRLWDVESGREVLVHFKDPTGRNVWLAVSPDGHRLLSAGGRELQYRNLDTGKLIQKLKWEEDPVGGSFTPDGRHVIWGGHDGLLRMYRLTDLPDRPIAPPQRSSNPKRR
jgi:WD40 repeat protein/serine/threonine protein kinase